MANTFAKNEATSWPVPNHWDAIALLLVIGVIIALGWGADAMLGRYQLGQTIPISLNPIHLPYYALRTFLRMLIAMGFSLLFTFTVGTLAAKNRHAERLVIPFIDIMQSVPVLGFLSITIVGFMVLFKGHLLGPECAAIFAIFTAQVWNMTLSFYQSLRTVPQELNEAAKIFQLSKWQRFWRIDVPFAVPGLLWNMMISMSSSWIFLVAAESITIAHHKIDLPGIGSYIALAIQQRDIHAIVYAIVAMVVVIALYDQLLFRPLIAWAQKFKAEDNADEQEAESWVLYLFQRTKLINFFGHFIHRFSLGVFKSKADKPKKTKQARVMPRWFQMGTIGLFYALIGLALLVAVDYIWHFIFHAMPLSEAKHVLYLGLITAIRVMAMLVIATVVWVPIGVWIGLRSKATRIAQPVVQFLAAFPANLFFPIVVLVIVRYHLNVNIWTSPLMLLGMQWYILFNVIAGAHAVPKNFHYAIGNLNVGGWLWWRKFILPAIFPYYITGAITAAGGAWNYSILVEAVQWGHYHLFATGVGAYITKAYTQGDFPALALGIVVMCLFVIVINRLLWRPLYNLAETKYKVK